VLLFLHISIAWKSKLRELLSVSLCFQLAVLGDKPYIGYSFLLLAILINTHAIDL